MPELPEVEAARRLLATHCQGGKITSIVLSEPFDTIVFSDADVTADTVSAALVGKRMVAVHRKGKQLWLELSSPPHLLAHFGMTGSFVVKGVAPLQYQEFKVHDETWPPRFTKLEIAFGTTRLAFCDPRRLGRMRLRMAPEAEEPICLLAPDPLLAPISLEAAQAVLQARRTPIKALLLDQAALVSGVGNWVADEVLFQARIHPEAACNTLSEGQVSRLHAALLHVVREAVRHNADATKFPPEWLFHYRWGKGKGGVPGPDGGSISFLTVGGRTSAVVTSVQKKGELRNAPVKPKAKGAAGKQATDDVKAPKTAGGKRGRRAAEESSTSAAATTKPVGQAAKRRRGRE